jgi:hypothetical protein
MSLFWPFNRLQVQNDEDDDVMGAREYSLMKRKTDDRCCWWKFFSPHVSLKLSEGHPEKFQGSTRNRFPA